ncbi:hypothetical protein RND71_002024 [Anisodus tanguticus]|uniref:MATH domain-containing protein n=1 Tax=Anisodus tanguticus TaxID=243964 RepID=A0AAE1T389_9SOLA|nr:hypothetical protein RND71_002024 [Anisodus tanguticus]
MADFCNEDGVSRSISETPPTHYTLKIQSLSLLKKNNIEKYTSPYFEAGGYKWKLVFHPNGNKNKNKAGKHVSVYLMMAEAISLAPACWEVHAVFGSFCMIKTTTITWSSKIHLLKREEDSMR